MSMSRAAEHVVLRANWPTPPRVNAVTTLRYGAGMSSPPFDRFNLGLRNGEDPQIAQRNRQELTQCLRLPAPPRWLRQVHGVEALRDPGMDEPQADAAVTSHANYVLAVLTADCLPVALAAEDGSEVAVAHAGWRGLAAGVLEATVAAMRTRPPRILAWLGPAAGPQAYEIGTEVREAFLQRDPAARAAFVVTRPGHWRIDLYELARQRLQATGITAARIHGGGLCTIADPTRFYSHRRDQRTGRMATLAWIDSDV